jgi:hypothetical protein
MGRGEVGELTKPRLHILGCSLGVGLVKVDDGDLGGAALDKGSSHKVSKASSGAGDDLS